MLLIYAAHISPRLNYIISFIFDNFLANEYRITDNFLFFEQSSSPKLYYQANFNPAYSAIFLQAANLLFEEDIKPVPTATVTYAIENKSYELLFPNLAAQSLLPYDIFAFCFLQLSRYEEYLPYLPDAHGRFAASQSLSQKYNYLHLPIIHLLAENFIHKLVKIYPQLNPKIPNYQFLPSYDIDYMRAFSGKGFWRQMGALGKNFFTGQWQLLSHQIATLARFKPDLYDTFAYLDTLHQQHQLSPHYFFLSAEWHTYDKNTPTHSPIFIQTVKNIASRYPIGLHPSYQSNLNNQLLIKEKNTLTAIAQMPILASRQHFLKLHLPQTYQNLLKIGIQTDYSMGYADACGFRAGTSLPFYWYDLSQNKVSRLQLQPLVLMDVTLRNYLKLSPQQSLQLCKNYYQTLRRYGGNYAILFHNNSFCETMGWQGWQAMYEEFLTFAKN